MRNRPRSIRSPTSKSGHDYVTAGATGYFGYFGAAAGDPTEGWYAYDVGTWRIYALNTECANIGGCGSGSPEGQWLTADLDAHLQPCIAAVTHRPRYSSGEHGGSSSMPYLWTVLWQHGAEFVVSGHDHDYERFAAQDDAGQSDPTGTVQVVVGTGGADLRPFAGVEPNSLVRIADECGVLSCTLDEASYVCDWVRVDDVVRDAFSGTCLP